MSLDVIRFVLMTAVLIWQVRTQLKAQRRERVAKFEALLNWGIRAN